jgi:hypothetical protein
MLMFGAWCLVFNLTSGPIAALLPRTTSETVKHHLFTDGNNSGNLPFGAGKRAYNFANIFPINYFQKRLEPYNPW